MAYTATYYNKKVHVLAENAIWSFVRWLVNDTTSTSTPASAQDAASSAGPTGPGWHMVACRSNNNLFKTQATGSITTVAGASLVDGETVTIDDGGVTKVFEFDDDGSWTSGNVQVAFTAGDTADQVRDALISAINQFTGTLFTIEASSGGAATVSLINRLAIGTAANSAITETVVNAGFTVSGMSGAVQSSGAGTLSGISDTGDGIATNWTGASVLTANDWCVLQSNRIDALGRSAQATGVITPDITSSPASSTATITINGTTLTGIDGTRVSGSDNFNRGVTPAASLAAEIAAALNDTANSFIANNILYEARVVGSTVEVEADTVAHYGQLGNLMDLSTTSSGTSGSGYSVDNPTLTGGQTTDEFELYLDFESTTPAIDMLLIPLATYLGGTAAFDTSTADASPPTFPSLSVGLNSGVTADSAIFEPSTWVWVADEGVVTGFIDGAALDNVRYNYVGDLEGALPSDEAPFVIRSQADEVHHENGSGEDHYGRVSPADDSTVLSDGGGTGGFTFQSRLHTNHMVHDTPNFMPNVQFGKWTVLPVGVYYDTLAHRHAAGFLRRTYTVHYDIGMRGTLGGRAYAFRVDTLHTDNHMPILIEWDSLTPF